MHLRAVAWIKIESHSQVPRVVLSIPADLSVGSYRLLIVIKDTADPAHVEMGSFTIEVCKESEGGA
jgi:hypothetical protein